MAFGNRLIHTQEEGGGGGVLLDINNFNFAGRTTIDPSETGSYTSTGGAFGNNGTIFYANIEYPLGFIYQYSLSTPYDITTRSYVTQFSFPEYLQNLRVIDSSNFVVYMTISGVALHRFYTMTNWNISTAVATSNELNASTLNALNNNASTRGVMFNEDGTKAMVRGWVSNTELSLASFNLSTPYNLSDLTLGNRIGLSSLLNVPEARGLNGYSNGTSTILGTFGNGAYIYNVQTTNWDASTASVYQTLNIGSSQGITNMPNLNFYPDQNIMLGGIEPSIYVTVDYIP